MRKSTIAHPKSTIGGPKSTIRGPLSACNSIYNNNLDSLKDLKEIKESTPSASGSGVRENINQTQEGFIMNYPKNRKPRDTAYAKGTQLINTIGFDKIQQYWEKNGTSATIAMLNKIAPFPVSKGIVRNLVKKHGWRRRVTDMNDPLYRLVLKDPARIPDFKHVQFMFRGIPIEDLICWIQNILQNHPNLCYCGLKRCYTHKGWLRGFETQLSELAIAIAYLEHATPSVKLTKGKKIHSYSLKHRMEQGYNTDDEYQGFVCNGTAILAAFLCRFPVRQCEKDPTYAWVGIAKVKQPYQRRLV